MITEMQFRSIIELFNICCANKGRTLHPSMLNWMYNDPKFPVIMALRYDKDKLIGHYAVRVFKKNTVRGVCKTAVSFSSMVHPDYRYRGIFVSLASEVYDSAKKEGVECICGFPNKSSSHGLFDSLNWQKQSGILSYAIPTSSFCDGLPAIGRYEVGNLVLSVHEMENLKYRIREFPTYNRGTYEIFGFHSSSGSVKNFAVTKIFYGDVIIRHVLKIHAESHELFNHTLDGVRRKSFEEGFTFINGWKSPEDRIECDHLVTEEVVCGQLSFNGNYLSRLDMIDSDSF